MGPVRQNQIQRTVTNCSSKCAYDCAQLQYTIQHRTVLIISPSYLQTTITAQMLSIGEQWGEGVCGMEVPSHIHCSRFLSSTLSRTSSFWTLSVPANECLSVANSQSCPWRHRRHIHRWRQMAVLRRRHGRTAAGQWLDYGPCLVPSAVPTVNIHQSPVSSSVSSGGTVGLRAVVRIRAVHICILKIQTCGAKIWVTLFLYIIVHNSPALP